MHGMEMGGQLNRIIEQNYKYLTNNLKNLSWHLIGFEINNSNKCLKTIFVFIQNLYIFNFLIPDVYLKELLLFKIITIINSLYHSKHFYTF